MKVEIRNRPAFANIRLRLSPGESIVAEADAMASMDTSVEMKTRWSGGPLRAILKRIFGGESLFINEFSTPTGGELVLTQPMPGDIECLELQGNTMYFHPVRFWLAIRESSWNSATQAYVVLSPVRGSFA